MQGKPEFVSFEETKLVTSMGISITVDGLILTLHCVEAADVAAIRATTPQRLNFLLPPEHALALGKELLRQARPSRHAKKH